MDENKDSNNLNRFLVGGLIILIIVGIFLIVFLFSFRKENTGKANQPPVEQTANWQAYTSTQYGQTISFKYPNSYSTRKGGRPFNINNEGPSITVDLTCSNSDQCKISKDNTLEITLYENRQKWGIDTWMQKSVNRPQANCEKKDERASLVKSEFKSEPAYEYTFISDGQGIEGCLENPISQTLYGKDILYINNQTVFKIRKVVVEKELKNDFDEIIQTIKVE
ncbi:MAG: hypothetical protein M3Q44_01530 [bacterium]|nr:hypothetical protein [bacterium]